VLASGQADGLVLNYALGYRERTLDFLRPWPVRRLQVLARTITNIEPVYRMAETLEDLSLTTAPAAAVDCARLPHLHGIWAENWQQLRQSLPLAHGLQELGVYGYGETDLLALTGNTGLRSVTLKQAPPAGAPAWHREPAGLDRSMDRWSAPAARSLLARDGR
jgi:hypothetical protein